MQDLKQTLNHIYKTIIPDLNLNIEDHENTGFLHFEKYDYRFQWNNPKSVIEIYLPLKK